MLFSITCSRCMRRTLISRCGSSGRREPARSGTTGESIFGHLADDACVRVANGYRITIHNASWDYEGAEPRHGTRVSSLAEKPYFKADAPTRRQALGILSESEISDLNWAKSN